MVASLGCGDSPPKNNQVNSTTNPDVPPIGGVTPALEVVPDLDLDGVMRSQKLQ
jgi:hypothetical protein